MSTPIYVANLTRDTSTNAIEIIDYAHHELHSGSHYYAYREETIASTETIAIALQTPNTTKWNHLIWKLSSSDAAVFDILETVTSIASGTSFTPLNNDRNSANVSGNTITAGDDTTGDEITPTGGTEIYKEGVKFGNKIGSDKRGDAEIILKQNTLYLFRLTSGANSNVCSLVLEWYEHTNKGE